MAIAAGQDIRGSFSAASSAPSARSELSAICKAVGVITPNDSQELHDLPLEIKVGMKRRSDTGEMTNEIKGYSKKSSPGQAPQAETDAPPWARR